VIDFECRCRAETFREFEERASILLTMFSFFLPEN